MDDLGLAPGHWTALTAKALDRLRGPKSSSVSSGYGGPGLRLATRVDDLAPELHMVGVDQAPLSREGRPIAGIVALTIHSDIWTAFPAGHEHEPLQTTDPWLCIGILPVPQVRLGRDLR